jgi:hypothetical protein
MAANIEQLAPGVDLLVGPAWRKVFSVQGIKEANQMALEDALRDFQTTAIPRRFWPKKNPAGARVTWLTLFARGREAQRRGLRNVPGAPDLQEIYDGSFGGWDPWGTKPPPTDQVLARNRALLMGGRGGFRGSRDERWTRARREYRRWAKQHVRKWLAAADAGGRFNAITLTGELRSVAQTGKVRVGGSAKKSWAELSIPRAGRQNRQVQKIFGGGGRSMPITGSEWERIRMVVRNSIAASVTGKTSKIPTKGRRARA